MLDLKGSNLTYEQLDVCRAMYAPLADILDSKAKRTGKAERAARAAGYVDLSDRRLQQAIAWCSSSLAAVTMASSADTGTSFGTLSVDEMAKTPEGAGLLEVYAIQWLP